jgi:adenylate kinase family enzyme
MKRILIVGSAGAGKSTLARTLGVLLNLPVIHLDAMYWNAGWIETPKSEWPAKVAAILGNESWIIDGNYSSTLEARLAAADAAIFLDFQRLRCLVRALRRWIAFQGTTRPDMPLGYPEKIDWEFLKWIWDYPARTRPMMLQTLEKFADRKRVFILRDPGTLERFLRAVKKNQFRLGKENRKTEQLSAGLASGIITF